MHALRYALPLAIFPILMIGSTLPAGPQEQAVHWRHDFSKAWDDAQKSGRPMVLHFYADWCGPCRQMDRNVLNTPNVLKQLETGFVAVKINSDKYPELVQKFNIQALPSDVFIDPDGRVISQSEGYSEQNQYLAKLARIDAQYARSKKIQIAKDEARKETQLPLKDDDKQPVIGLDGYSPVALTNSRQWITGKAEFEFIYQDITYRMSSAEELNEFKENPRKYSPRLLGCDPVILWNNDRAIAGSTEFGAFFDGELFLFSSKDSRAQFQAEPNSIHADTSRVKIRSGRTNTTTLKRSTLFCGRDS